MDDRRYPRIVYRLSSIARPVYIWRRIAIYPDPPGTDHQLVKSIRRFHIHHMAGASQHHAARAGDIALDQAGDGVEIRQVALADNHQHWRANISQALGR